jgi:hypothetical protein
VIVVDNVLQGGRVLDPPSGDTEARAIVDFNKLVLGAAANKLFVGPRGCMPEYLESLIPVARCCGGKVYTALVTHPDEWDEGGQADVFELRDGRWDPVDAT